MNNYNAEVKQRFGETNAYKEYTEKTADYTKDKWKEVNDGLWAVFNNFAECKKKGYTADSAEAQVMVKSLKDYITENYYTCSKEILSGLGQMYVNDKRFKEKIDKSSYGTAQFVKKAIDIYVKL